MDSEQNVQKGCPPSIFPFNSFDMTYSILRVKNRIPDSSAQQPRAGLIMSATLTPPVKAVARSNPMERLEDYLEALRYYLELPSTVIDRILFIDNSASDLAPLHQLASEIPHTKDIELISFSGNEHPYQFGKAYGEFKLMDFGLEKTTLFGPEDVIWKTTGRLKFLNLAKMNACSAKFPFDILCDLHNVPWVGSGKWHNHQNMDLRVFAFRMSAYNALLRGLWHSREQGFDAEFFYHEMMMKNSAYRIVPRFPLQPRLQGISGRHQRDYQSPSQQVKDSIRSTLRRVIPWLWL
jgi:hypothetical protein